MGYRIVQFASGNVGRQAVKAVAADPDLELVGLYVRSPDKAGKDAGEICGLGRNLGVRATASLDDILALEADCVLHMPLPSLIWGDDPEEDTETIVKLLESGKNVITTVGYLYPKALGAGLAERLTSAAIKGGVSLHGTGFNPGFIGEVVPLTFSAMSARIDRMHVTEVTNFAFYPSPDIMLGMMRMGQTPEAFEATSSRLRHWLGGLFRESVMLVADGLGLELDDIEETYELILADAPLKVAAGLISSGTVAGQHWTWSGVKDGRARVVHETFWRMHESIAPHWPRGGISVAVEGEPNMKLDLPETWITDVLLATALKAVNAIPAVCAAAPGLRSVLDLPMIVGRNVAR